MRQVQAISQAVQSRGCGSQSGDQRSKCSAAGAAHAVAFAARTTSLAYARRSTARGVGFGDQAAAASRAGINGSQFARRDAAALPRALCVWAIAYFAKTGAAVASLGGRR